MKLTVFFLTAAFLNVSARGVSQNVTFSGKDVSLESVISSVEKQTGYVFLYTEDILKTVGPVSLKANNLPLRQFLDELFRNQPISYSLSVKSILLSRKDKSVPIGEPAPPALNQMATSISGRVVDTLNKPIEGASVRITPGNRGTSTGSDGAFVITNVNPGNYTLEVSLIGYLSISRKITVSESAPSALGSLVLRVNPETMESVTIISTGYQALPKERVTGSFKVISGEQLEKAGSSLSQRLIGSAAGVVATINPSTGAASFQIRGVSTMGANASPLIVIDNFAVSETDFNQINPNNVESVVFLKDAAAASIWGARAANGVIVVTTKSGKKGNALSVEASAFTQVANKLDVNYARGLANSQETIDYERNTFNKFGSATVTNAIANSGVRRSQAFILMNEQFLGFLTADQMNAGLATLRNQENADQIRKYLLSNPITNQVNISLSGGTEKMTNSISLLYETNQFDFKRNDNKKMQINYKTTASIAKWLDFDASFMGQYVMANNSGYSVNDLKLWSPYDMFVNPDGSKTNIPAGLGGAWYYPMLNRFVPTNRFPYTDWTYNPVVDLETRNITAQTLNARVQGGLTIKVMKGISLRSSIQYDNFNVFNRGYYDERSYQVRNSINTASSWDQTPNGTITPLLPKGAQLSQSRSQATGYTWRNQLNIDRSFGRDHQMNIALGTEASHRINQGFTHPTTYGYNDVTLGTGAFTNGIGGRYSLQPSYRISTWLSPGSQYSISGIYNSFSYSTDRFVSMFGTGSYTYKGKYSLSASLRSDASNLITDDPKYRYEPFWSIGARWNVYRESFMKSITWLDELNLRATFGYQGNVDRSTSFLPLLTIGSSVNAITGVPTNTISSFGNPSLRWERTAATNLGIDFSLLNRKLFGTLEYYTKNSRELIARVSIPSANGTNVQSLNNGAMVNKGVNIELGTYQDITRNLRWTGNLNFAYNFNKITDYFYATYQYWELPQNAQIVEGHNLNEVFSVRYAGLDTDGYPMVYAGPKAVKTRISTQPSATGDPRNFLEASGTTVPPYTLGLTNSFKYKDFNLSFIVTGRFGAIYRATPFNMPFQQSGAANRVLPNSRLRYAINGDGSSYLPMPTNAADPTLNTWPLWGQYLDYLIESANVVRMQEINLSYNLNPAFITRLGLRGINVYAQGNNLFVITNNRYNEDPEFREGSIRPMPRFILGLRARL